MSDLYLLTQSPKSYGRVVLALFVVGVTVNDLLNARGVYLILALKGGASNRYMVFIRRGRLFLI